MPESKQHFLPQCYQRGFADSSGKVWIKFSGKHAPEHRNPDSVGWCRGLYQRMNIGQEIEDFFSKEVENNFAKFSRRVKDDPEFSEVSGEDLGVLARFVASQSVRTLAHEQCIQEQAGAPVDRSVFNRVMLRKMWTMIKAWTENFPTFHFYTPLPLVGDRFITGDHPVLVTHETHTLVWTPVGTPTLQITGLMEILQNPTHAFWLALTPYVCASIQGPPGDKPHLPPEKMEPSGVRRFNEAVRGQCKLFTLARDRESLL